MDGKEAQDFFGMVSSVEPHIFQRTSHMIWQSKEEIERYAPMEERPTKGAKPAYNP